MAPVPCSVSSVSASQPEKPHDNVTSINSPELDATHISELVAYLGTVPQSINIPHDFVREDTEKEAYERTAPFVIDDGLLSRLVERTGGSSASCLVSVFAVTLHLFAALQEDFAIAVSLDACRPLALRAKFQHAVDMEVLHGIVRDDLEFLAQRQAVPLDALVKVLGVPSETLFRASFMLQGSPEDGPLLTHGELVCLVKPNSNGSLTGSFIYDSSILAHDTVLSFSTAFTRVLSAWAGEPTPNLDAVAFTDAPTHFPSQPRLDVPDVSFVYTGELFSRARRIQNLVRPYRRRSGAVLLLLDRTVDFIAAEIGANLAGMAFIPCDVGQPAARIRDIVLDAGPACIVAHRNALHRLGVGEEIGVPLLLADTAFEPLEASPAVETSPDEPGETAYTIYTSGSTGKPKGVAIGHASAIAFVRNIAGWVRSGTALNGIVTANIAWDPSIHHTYPALATGGCVKIPKIDGEKDGEYLSALMRASPGVNIYGTTSAALRMWLSQTASRPGSFFPPGMLHVCLGGDEAPPRFVEQVFAELAECPNAEVRHIYGPTEGTIFGSYDVLTRSSLGRLKGRRRTPLERFMPHVAMTVANAAGNELPRGFVGEIIIWGPSLLLEYHSLPEVNAQRFLTKDGVRGWRSGDLGRRLPSGELEILGRMDSMRKVKGGFRVELQEIEAHVQSFAEVDKCHISTTQAGGSSAEQQIVAHIVFKEGRGELEKVKEWKEMLVEDHKMRADDAAAKEQVDLSFDYRGWNSALGRRNFTHEEMTEWIDAVLARIMEAGCFKSSSRKPRVLELGCGTGMILFRLAEMCEKYTAIDFLPSAVAQVQAHARTLGLENVDVHVAAAHQFADVVGTGDLFDLIICNSVVMYFPSLDYLTTVINQAGASLAPGGALFLGDIRNAALASQFAAARAISHGSARSVPELAQAMKVFERAEEELLVDPAWFIRFAWDSAVFESASSMVKRGSAVTDMTLFRYDVVMRSATPLPMQGPNVHVAPAHDDVIAQVRASPAPTLLQNIGNRRISEYHYLSGTHFEPSLSLSEVLHDAKRYAEGSGHHPEALVTQASTIENVTVVPLCSMTRPECFDLLVLNRDTAPDQLNRLIYEAHLRSSTHNIAQDRGTTPRGKVSRLTLALLHEHLSQRVPAYMVPSYVVPVPSLPLTSSHKVDKAKLPEPCPDDRFVPTGKSVEQWDTEDEAHRPIVEAILRVFSEVLFVDKPLSPKDNFFFCGGHSLVAAQATSLIRRELSVELPFTAIIASPTASQLAVQIDSLRKKTEETARVPNILPLNWSPNLRPKAMMFIFPLVGGDLDKMPEFMNKIDDGTLGIALYGIAWEPNQHLNTLEKITQSYANSIASIAGSTPTFLIGWCYGGTLATCVAQRLPKATTKVILLNSPSIGVMAGTGAMSKESQDELSHSVTTIDYVWDVAALQYTAYEASQRRFDSASIQAREKASKELIEANIDRHDFAQLIQFIRARFHFPEWVTDAWLSRYLLPLADNYDVIHDVEENYSFLPSDIASMEEQVVLNLVCKKPYAGLPFGLGWSRYQVIGSDEWNYGYLPEILDMLRVTLREYILGNQSKSTAP